jgi:hypothetical protein
MEMGRRRRASISKGRSYEEIGEYWDTHDAGELLEDRKPVEFEVDIRSERFYCAVERSLFETVTRMARERGVSAETLVNLWIQEKVSQG